MRQITTSLRRRGAAVLLVMAGAGLGIAGAAAVPAASATTVTPGFTINPNTIYYPCNEGNVTFTVRHFPASSSVELRIGTATATPFAYLTTSATGQASITLSFSGYYQGVYKVIASSSPDTVTRSLTVGECP